jgi:hypothetical protein
MLDYWDCYGFDFEVDKSGGENYSIRLSQWIDEHHQLMHPEGRFYMNLGTDVSATGTIRLRIDNEADESTFYFRYMGGEEDPSNSSSWRTACTFNYSTGVWAINDYRAGNLKDQEGVSITFEYGSNGTFNSLSYPQITSPNALYEAITVEFTGFFIVSDNEENWKNSEVRFLDFNSSFEDPVWVPQGWVYYSWPYAYSFSEGRWHFFNESDTQLRVNTTSREWSTLDAASGWNYYAWPYSYSFDEGAWHWYNNDTQFVVDLISRVWSTFGRSGY